MALALATGWAALFGARFARYRPASASRSRDLLAARPNIRRARGPFAARSKLPAVSRQALVTAAGCLVVAAVVFPPAALVVVAVVIARPVLRQRRQRRAFGVAVEHDLADAVALIGLAVSSGHNLAGAVLAAGRRGDGPVFAALRGVTARVDRGERLADVLETLPDELGDVARPVVVALVSCDRYGAPLGSTLERLGADVRIASRQRSEAAARRLPIRLLFPLVTCILPAFALLTVAPLIAGSFRGLRL